MADAGAGGDVEFVHDVTAQPAVAGVGELMGLPARGLAADPALGRA